MCTLSWRARSSASYEIVFNRDEVLSRPRGLKPVSLNFESPDFGILCPLDPVANGTWFGVNQNGMSVALLNLYGYETGGVGDKRSRGLLVMDLLRSSRSYHDAAKAVKEIDLQLYSPFTLFLLDQSQCPRVFRWDGKTLVSEKDSRDQSGGMLSSSSYKTDDVLKFRRDLFSEISAGKDGVQKFHHYKHDDHLAYGPLMFREDAATDSICKIIVDTQQAQLEYRGVDREARTIDSPVHYSMDLKCVAAR